MISFMSEYSALIDKMVMFISIFLFSGYLTGMYVIRRKAEKSDTYRDMYKFMIRGSFLIAIVILYIVLLVYYCQM